MHADKNLEPRGSHQVNVEWPQGYDNYQQCLRVLLETVLRQISTVCCRESFQLCVCFVSSMSEMISTTKSNSHGSRRFRLADLKS